jgi:hypothetical protein
MRIDSPGDRVLDNVIIDVDNDGVFVAGGADGAHIIGNLIVRTQTAILFSTSGDGVAMWHNTIVGSGNTGINMGNSVGADIRNNVFVGNTTAVNGGAANISEFDYNLFYTNTANCIGCTAFIGPNSRIEEDPVFANPVETGTPTLDYSLGSGSAAANRGFISTEDRNRGGAGLYYGALPDLGAFESTF